MHTCEHGYQTMHQEKGTFKTVATKSGRLKLMEHPYSGGRGKSSKLITIMYSFMSKSR